MAMAREADPRLAEIGAKIRIFRNRLGWTIENLALEADLTTPQVSEIERGLRSAGMRAYLAIADALKVSLSDIQPDGMKEAAVDPVLHDVAEQLEKTAPEKKALLLRQIRAIVEAAIWETEMETTSDYQNIKFNNFRN